MNETKGESPSNELSGDNSTNYELFSIMIHSGSATGGHYYAYIKCFETNQWLNFNDERVSRLDSEDIKKAFGTSFSTYSSTTAYMLLYRQINSKRNEKVIKEEDLDDHLRNVLSKEREQQIEADRLKEYMDNACKIKVMVPCLKTPTTSEGLDDLLVINEIFNKSQEKTVDIHKELTLEQAKLEIIKMFDMEEYFKQTKQKCRILKYDTYNELIDQSYRDEHTTTVYEALGFSKFPYGMCWYLDVVDENEEFVGYNRNDFYIKIINLNISTFETDELFNVRVSNKFTVFELRELIAQVRGICFLIYTK